MIGRLAWVAALVVVAVVACFAELDRASRLAPRHADMVPQAFSGFAAERRARQALEAGDAELAMHRTRRLIAARPLPSLHQTMMAHALVLSGDLDAANAALALAASRGWREPLAQLAAAQGALDNGDYESAADRMAALMAIGSDDPAFGPLLATLLADGEGRSALAVRVAGRGRWQRHFIGMAQPHVPPEDLALVLARALALGAGDLPCDRLLPVAAELERTGRADLAAPLRSGSCV